MAKRQITDSAFKDEAYAPKKAPAPRMKGRGKAPVSGAANTASPGGSMNVLRMWSKDNHKTGLRK